MAKLDSLRLVFYCFRLGNNGGRRFGVGIRFCTLDADADAGPRKKKMARLLRLGDRLLRDGSSLQL